MRVALVLFILLAGCSAKKQQCVCAPDGKHRVCPHCYALVHK